MSLDWDKIHRYDMVRWFKIIWECNVWIACYVDELRIFLYLVVWFGNNVEISKE